MPSCTPEVLRIWSGATGGNYLAFGVEPTGAARVDIVETSSGRIVLGPGGNWQKATATDKAELQAILDSIQIEPTP